ncbi:MAG: DMT family transporter [Eggerthellaceae bacterium]|nr:DMT family transporter [Eggerthellaceae bacterium]
MARLRDIPPAVYKLLIVLATVIWGLSFVVMKDAVDVMQPAWLIGVRFLITAGILTVVLWRHVRPALTRPQLARGAVLGVLLFLAYWTQTVGLAFTTPGKNAFLTATYCVMVPFMFWAVAGKRPTVFNLVAAVLCVAGMGLVSLSGGALTLEFGDAMTLVCAVFFGAHIVAVARLSQDGDVLALTVFQFWVMGLCGVVLGALTEAPPDAAAVSPEFLFNMAYLIVLASCVALVIQNVALAHVPPAQASLLLSLEAVFGVVFSVLLYGETLTMRLVAGFALIFGAIVLSEVFPLRPRSQRPEDIVAAPPVGDLLMGDNMAAGELEEALEIRS